MTAERVDLTRSERVFVNVFTWVVSSALVLGLMWIVDQDRPGLVQVVVTGIAQGAFLVLRWPQSLQGRLVGLGCLLALLAMCAFRGNWTAVLVLVSVVGFGVWHLMRRP